MLRIFILLSALLVAPFVQAVEFDHSDWDGLLKEHVQEHEGGVATQVDYAGFAKRRGELKTYLQKLSAIESKQFDSWAADEQLAFLINAYNSWTVELILTRYPDLESIKDLGSIFQSPWKKRFIPLLGKERSLDDIEHSLIRGSDRYNDPRIHFAVNCASIGCPALRAEAYAGARLQQQLNEAASLFLRDRSRNRLKEGVLEVSSIFKWYREDFEKGWQSISSLEQFFKLHAKELGMAPQVENQLLAGSIKIKFLSYDWRLNGLP